MLKIYVESLKFIKLKYRENKYKIISKEKCIFMDFC